MPVLESSLERRVVKWAEGWGISHTKLNIMGRRGWPDRVFWIGGGRPLLMEFKRKGHKPTRLQQAIMKRLKESGYNVCWTDDYETAIAYLRHHTAI